MNDILNYYEHSPTTTDLPKSHDFVKGRDIVIVGQQPWDVEIGSNCKNIALEFSKNNRVLYVNSALDRITQLRNKHEPKVQRRLAVVQGKQDGLVHIKNDLWNLYPDRIIESVNWIKSHWAFNMLNKLNNRRFAGAIRKAIDILGFKDYILFNDNDIFRSYYLKELLDPSLSIYYSRDYLLTVDYWKFHGTELEPRLISKSDICVANSTYLANYCRQYNSRSYCVGQGCELEMFTNRHHGPTPEDMKHIPKPVIGYVGALESIRLDIELIEYIAEQADWNIVLIGPEDEPFRKSRLHKIKNVWFLGAKPPNTLPSYINTFDVCLNPQALNQLTIGNYPRKMDEYLAMGKPVVATRTEAMELFSEYIYMADTKEDYVQLIGDALAEDTVAFSAQRSAFASSHSWENNVKEIYKVINRHSQL